jgi:hypothetical protein
LNPEPVNGYKNWVLALYPSKKALVPILVNWETGQWTDDLKISFAKRSPASKMLAAMKKFYRKEV